MAVDESIQEGMRGLLDVGKTAFDCDSKGKKKESAADEKTFIFLLFNQLPRCFVGVFCCRCCCFFLFYFFGTWCSKYVAQP